MPGHDSLGPAADTPAGRGAHNSAALGELTESEATHVPVYQDLFDLSEDQRIDLIGHMVVDHKQTNAFVVEDDAKADRYIKKLVAKFPGVEVVGRGKGPIAGTVYVKVGPRADA